MMLSTVLATLALAATQVAAHGGVIGYNIGGKYYKGFTAYNSPSGQSSIQREWDTYNPLYSATDSSLACNTNGATLGSQLTASVPAGSKIVSYWNSPWPHAIGPVLTYMASCGSTCNGVNQASLNWFKIDQAGLLSGNYGTGTWAAGKLIAQNSSWTSTIPSDLKPGAYLYRNELIAIHTANQPQFYPECAQFQVTGSGSASPSGSYLVKFPGAYKATDPGINIDVYSNPSATTYTIPGPAVWSG